MRHSPSTALDQGQASREIAVEPVGDFGVRVDDDEAALFVGRERLLDELERLAREADDAPRIACMVGPAGAGKTTLARQLGRRLGERKLVWLSAERVAPNVAAFERAIDEASEGGLARLGRGGRADVLVIDGFERLRPIEGWFFDVALRHAGARLCLVLTSRDHVVRHLPGGLRFYASELAVKPFTDAEAEEYLRRRGVAPELRSGAIAYAEGYPLALSLLAERLLRGANDALNDERDVVESLVSGFVRDAPSAMYEDAIYALALPPVLDEAALGAMLGCDSRRSRELFRWLERLTFVERGKGGLVPHGLVRRALYDHLAVHDPARHHRMAEAAAELMLSRATSRSPLQVHDEMMAALYMCRRASPLLDAFGFDRLPRTYCRPCTRDTIQPFAEMVERWEGRDSRERFLAAFEWDGELMYGVYGVNARPVALIGHVCVRSLPAAIRRGDPILEAAFDTFREREPGARHDLSVARWWMTADTYQAQGQDIQALVTGGAFVTSLRAPTLRWAMVAASPAEAWERFQAPFGLSSAGRVTTGGRTYTLALADAHTLVGACSPLETSRRIARLHFHRLTELGDIAVEPTGAALEYERFAAGLRAALSSLHAPRELAKNALLDALICAGQGSEGVARAIGDAVGRLALDPACAESAHVLRVTYLDSHQKQLAAAAELNLSFATYRRRLRRAVDDLVAALWAAETRERAGRVDARRERHERLLLESGHGAEAAARPARLEAAPGFISPVDDGGSEFTRKGRR